MKTKKITVLMLILVFAFGGLPFQISQVEADEAVSSADATNVIPVASSVSIDSATTSVALTENTTTTVTVTAIITDENGCEDIDSVEVKLYRTNVAGGAGAADDDNNHYTIAAVSDGDCDAGGSDLTEGWTATFSVEYYADPTDAGSVNEASDWTAEVTPSDESAGTSATDTIEMDTLTALDVTDVIEYGELALGGNTGAGDTTTTITNTGNEAIDVEVDGYGLIDTDGLSMSCDWGTIPVANEKYATSTSVAYATKTELSDTAAPVQVSIAQRTTTVTTGDIYWGFGMPTDGVGGDCTGKVIFTAISDI